MEKLNKILNEVVKLNEEKWGITKENYLIDTPNEITNEEKIARTLLYVEYTMGISLDYDEFIAFDDMLILYYS